jgi:hypothetical protein
MLAKPKPYKPEKSSDLVEQLSLIALRLRKLGVATLSITILNIVVLVGGATSSIAAKQFNETNSQSIAEGNLYSEHFTFWWLIANLAIFAISIVVLGVSDTFRRRGDAVFQELSGNFQEYEEPRLTSSGTRQDGWIAQTRLTLRFFASAADPPLVRGRYGVGIYALVNTVIVLMAVIVYSNTV